MDEISHGRPVLDADDRDATTDPDDTWRHPVTLGLAAFVLAVLSLFGSLVMRGSAYTLAFAPSDSGFSPSDPHGYLVAGAFLSAAFALLPLALARTGRGRLVDADPRWARHLLYSAELLALISFVLHLLLALASTQASSTSGLFLEG